MEGPEARMAKSFTYSDDRIPGGRAETNPFTERRNNVVLSTLPCGTPSEGAIRKKDFMKPPMFLCIPWGCSC